MAYCVIYEWKNAPESEKKTGAGKKFLPAAIVAGAILAIRLLFPQTDLVIKELLHPLTDESTVSAFSELVEQIAEGSPVEEAVTAFCRDILDNGK